MPQYHATSNTQSGVPLGGVGAGKIEIMPNGTLDFLTFMNNWRTPIANAGKGLFGFHFGIFCAWENNTVFRLLQTQKVLQYPTVEDISYNGKYPCAVLEYKDSALPVTVTLEALSPVAPNAYADSALPAALFHFDVSNTGAVPVDVTLVMIARNVVGKWYIGRTNRLCIATDKQAGIAFEQDTAYYRDTSFGNYAMVVHAAGNAGYMNAWNSQMKNFLYDETTVKLDVVDYLMTHHAMPRVNSPFDVQCENTQITSSVGDTFAALPHEKQRTTFVLSWYFPETYDGHFYTRTFTHATDVAEYVCSRIPQITSRVHTWMDTVTNTDVPQWLSDALLNNLYVLSSSSWLTKSGDFTLYEAPQICPLMGTLDVGFYATIPVALFFPEWEKKYLTLFANAQRANGYIPHDLGFECLNKPSKGTTFYDWKDLNAKFVLMLYRDYKWTHDRTYLDTLYPAAVRALDWLFAQQKNNFGLPENEGADQTFDTWDFFGVNSYTAGLYLAALRAMEEMASLVGDTARVDAMAAAFEKGKKAYVDLLWNGDYFIAAHDGTTAYSTCTVGQLAGQWYAHLLGLGYLVDEEKVKRALQSIARLNDTASQYGAVNSVYPDRTRDMAFIHSRNFWPAVIYAYSALCFYEGLYDEGFRASEKVWRNFTDNIKNPWNQADCINPDDGKYVFGDYYMRNMGIWALPLALAKNNQSVAEMLKTLTEKRIKIN